MAQIAEIASARASAPTILQRIVLARGWTRRAIAFCAGAAGALALAPFDVVPAMFAPLTVAVWLIDGAADGEDSPRFALAPLVSAAGAGWWLGFGYFVAGLWWMGAAMLVEADQFAWALPLAVFGLPAVLAIFPAAGFALARLLWSPGGVRVFALAAGLGAAEWLRGHLFTGFPWNDFGMALTSAGPMAQTASLVGLHGLDIIAIVIFAAPATLIDRAPRGARRIGGTMRAAAALAMLMFAYGVFRLGANMTEYVDGVTLRLMQPNLPQDAKFRPENGAKILHHYLALSERATSARTSGLADVTHLVWPESAFPYVISRHPEALAAIARALKGGVLLTGAARAENDGDGRSRIFNSIEALKGESIVAFYDKVHLVPFGEYLPLEDALRPLGINHLVPGIWDRGAGPRLLVAPGLPPIAPLICYEAIFPGEAIERGAQRPRLFLNLTNDGWFGRTTGPYQHLAQARLRAIEEGLPMIRVANTGVSAIIDAYGRILQSLPLGEEGLIDGRLPREAAPTVFATYGALAFPALLAAATALALLGVARRRP
ncbi:apolipoprotein N-acyltransferase [Methylocystis sp. SC2]|uniref:apolipoprotein N-acyltransferase n=1 Tax=Methylocystis sp. (strain SC2) TaxID=187303 RepID=UPI00027AEE15|nr:apolipoprotein N-acyltransferase [Methylocystis sp. SC2]CCJ06357.1 Apolipoprotein N-acyltransferase [Methylocystis sp. SC2]